MEGKEIKRLIEFNDKRLTELLTKDRFVLNKEISKILDENAELAQKCPHKFENGQCIYCRIKEK